MTMSVPARDTDEAGTVFTADCPGREVFNHITSRWGLLILVSLGGGPMRFHLLRDHIEGISEKMLSQTLKILVRDGLVGRFVEPSIPPRVTYELTGMGRELAAPLQDVVDCLGQRTPDIIAAQRRYDRMS